MTRPVHVLAYTLAGSVLAYLAAVVLTPVACERWLGRVS